MAQTPVILAEHLGKKFARSLKRAMVYGLVDVARAALLPHRFRSPHLDARLADAARDPAVAAPAEPSADDGLRPSEFWALRQVSFAVAPGECVGLVGHNGAGKSTLFSILSGIYGPTEGRVTIRGRLQALIALGAGFHPNLTGRENIFINAAILGLREKEIQALLPRIIEFSEIPEFMDAPVRTYSSGMVVRLGFSVAAHLNPDILLVDEVLAVGDSRFQSKCQEHMRKVMASGVAVMLVSHYMQNIQGMCSRAIWMNRGRLMMDGDAMEVTTAYQRHLFASGAMNRVREKEASGGFLAYLEAVRVMDDQSHPLRVLQSGGGAVIEVHVMSSERHECGRVYVMLQREGDTTVLMNASMLEEGWGVPLEQGLNVFQVRLRELPLREGRYQFYACVRSRDGTVALSNGCLSEPVTVEEAPALGGQLPVVKTQAGGCLTVRSEWLVPESKRVKS